MGRILSEEQKLMRQVVRDFVRDEVKPVSMEIDKANSFPRELHRRCGELGFIGADVPEGFGGLGASIDTSLLILQEIAKECPPLSMSLMISMTFPLFFVCENNEEHHKLIEPLLNGDLVGAFGETDPAGVLNIAEWPVLAVQDGDEFVLNGSKLFVTNAGGADLFIVSGLCDGKPRRFLVKKGTPGFECGHIERKTGMNGAANGTIQLNNVRIPVADEILITSYTNNLSAGYLHMASVALGCAEGAYDKTREYLKQRTNKMKPLIDMQVVAHKMARNATKLEACRAFINDAAILVEAGRPDGNLIRMVKAFVTEAAIEITKDCVQLYGGLGYCEDTGIARYLRDALGTSIGDLTADIQYDMIAKYFAKKERK